MTTTGKTPVSLLNEKLVRLGMQPIYNLLQSGVGTNQGTFVYEVAAGNLVTAVGNGRSKKEAKQNAAKKALAKMQPANEITLEPIDEDGDTIEDLKVVSPYDALMKDNAVGNLIELCATHEMPAPEYEQVREDGPPHAKYFEYSCKLANITEFAVGRTKRQAKQLAALNMLQKLDEFQIIELKSKRTQATPSTKLLAIEETVTQFTEARGESVRFPLGLKVGQGLKHDWTEEQLTFLQSLSAPFRYPTETLQLICNTLDLNMEAITLDSINERDSTLILSLNTLPENSFPGLGRCEQDARDMAALQAIYFLQVMAKS